MHDPNTGFSGFAQKRPAFLSRKLDLRGGTINSNSTAAFASIQGTWNTTGTPAGALVINVVDKAGSGVFTPFIDCQASGTSKFSVARTGEIICQNSLLLQGSGTVTVPSAAGYLWSARTQLTSPADGQLLLSNNAGTGWTRLQLGGTTSSFPGIGHNVNLLEILAADGAAGGGLLVYGTKTSGTNFERAALSWFSSVFWIYTEAGGGGGTNRDLVLGAGGQTEMHRMSGSSVAQSFFGATPVVKQTSGANLTNNVVASGTTDQIDDFTSLTVYSTDAQAIHNDIYQLARKLKQVNDALRAYGLLT